MPMPKELRDGNENALLEYLRGALTLNEFQAFQEKRAALALLPHPDFQIMHAWQALYAVNSQLFFKLVLPSEGNSTFANKVRDMIKNQKNKKYKTDHLDYSVAIIANVSDSFKEQDLKQFAEAWNVVAYASNDAHEKEEKYLKDRDHSQYDAEYLQLQAKTQLYDKYASQIAANILQIRPAQFKDLADLFDDGDVKRRNRRMYKYMFLDENSPRVQRIHTKVDELKQERKDAVEKVIQEDEQHFVKSLKDQSKSKSTKKGLGPRLGNTIRNVIVDTFVDISVQKKVVDSVYLQELRKEAKEFSPENMLYIHELDQAFGISADTLELNLKSTATPFADLQNIKIKDLTVSTIIATAQDVATNKLGAKIQSSSFVERGNRVARIAIAAVVLCVAIGFAAAAILFPPITPFIIAASVILTLAGMSFLYFKRDPIKKVTNIATDAVPTFTDSFMKLFRPKAPLNTNSFAPSAKAKEFLNTLDPLIATKLETHFRNSIEYIEKKSKQPNAPEDELKQELLRLIADWKAIMRCAEIAADGNPNAKETFYQELDRYIKDVYLGLVRPQLTTLAKSQSTVKLKDLVKKDVPELEQLQDILFEAGKIKHKASKHVL